MRNEWEICTNNYDITLYNLFIDLYIKAVHIEYINDSRTTLSV